MKSKYFEIRYGKSNDGDYAVNVPEFTFTGEAEEILSMIERIKNAFDGFSKFFKREEGIE